MLNLQICTVILMTKKKKKHKKKNKSKKKSCNFRDSNPGLIGSKSTSTSTKPRRRMQMRDTKQSIYAKVIDLIVSLVTSLTYVISWLKSQFYSIYAFLGVSWETTIVYHLLSCLRKKKKNLPLYRHFSDFKSHCGFSIAGAGYTVFQVWEGYFVSLIISTSNGSVFWVFYDY